AQCQYELGTSPVATVDRDGLVKPLRDGQAILRVAFKNCTAAAAVWVEWSATARPTGFRTDVVPLLSKAGCNSGACHGNQSGKGGFRLSLRGEDPAFDLQAITRDQLGRRIDCLAASESLIVRKPTGQVPHEGGMRFRHDSAE